jgi:hypothetical protein
LTKKTSSKTHANSAINWKKSNKTK